MSDGVSPLRGAVAPGPVTISDRGPGGMVGLRGDLADPALRGICTDLTGAAFPGPRAITRGERGRIGWMAPDELLLLVAPGAVIAALGQIAATLAGRHHLAVDLSDARAMIGVEGAQAREVLAKLSPADLHPDSFGPAELRRTRLGQIAAAFWMEDEGRFTVLCARSVADYAFRLLVQSAKDGPVGHY